MSRAEPSYLLDSFALLAYLNAEPGGDQVEEILTLAQAGQARLYLCLISLGEVLYITERRHGLRQAQRVLALVESLPLTLLEVPRDLVLEAAHLKAQQPISYAGAFAAVAARRENAVLLTGDPEFKSVEMLVEIRWIAGPG